MTIRLATIKDMEGVKALLRKYHRDTISDEDRPNGFVTTAITDEQLTELIEKEKGVTIIAEPAEDGPDKVLGFCFAAPWEFWTAWPLFRHMIDIIPDYEYEGKKLVVSDSYQYGPVCIDRSIRGTGAFEDLFYASLAQFRDMRGDRIGTDGKIGKLSKRRLQRTDERCDPGDCDRACGNRVWGR